MLPARIKQFKLCPCWALNHKQNTETECETCSQSTSCWLHRLSRLTARDQERVCERLRVCCKLCPRVARNMLIKIRPPKAEAKSRAEPSRDALQVACNIAIYELNNEQDVLKTPPFSFSCHLEVCCFCLSFFLLLL